MYHDRVGDDDKPALEFGQLVLTLVGTTVFCLLLARTVGFGWLAAVGLAYLGGAALTLLVAAVAVALAKPARGKDTLHALARQHDAAGGVRLMDQAGALAARERRVGHRA